MFEEGKRGSRKPVRRLRAAVSSDGARRKAEGCSTLDEEGPPGFAVKWGGGCARHVEEHSAASMGPLFF